MTAPFAYGRFNTKDEAAKEQQKMRANPHVPKNMQLTPVSMQQVQEMELRSHKAQPDALNAKDATAHCERSPYPRPL